MDVLQQFGINGKLLFVQFINFAILVAVMWKLVLPRLTTLMDERKRSIEEQLKAAEAARKEVAASREQRAADRLQAEADAAAVLKEAKEAGERTRVELTNAAKRDADAIRRKADEQLAIEREKLREELRAEVAALTVETTRKVLTDVVKPSDRQRMVKAASSYLKKSGGAVRRAGANSQGGRPRRRTVSAGAAKSTQKSKRTAEPKPKVSSKAGNVHNIKHEHRSDSRTEVKQVAPRKSARQTGRGRGDK